MTEPTFWDLLLGFFGFPPEGLQDPPVDEFGVGWMPGG